MTTIRNTPRACGLPSTNCWPDRPRASDRAPVMRVVAISLTTSSSVVAVDSTAPVQVRSPTVRYRTLVSNEVSPSILLHQRRHRVVHAVALEHLAAMGEVDRRQFELLVGDVLPDVGARSSWRSGRRAPARRGRSVRCHRSQTLGALVLGVPSAGVVAEGEDPLLGPGTLLVASRALRSPRPNRFSAIASSSVTDCRRLREARGAVLLSGPDPDRSSPGRWR